MKDEFLLSDTIVFDAKPIAVPYNYRTKNVIEKLPKEKYKRVNVPNKAFQLQKENTIERGMQDD